MNTTHSTLTVPVTDIPSHRKIQAIFRFDTQKSQNTSYDNNQHVNTTKWKGGSNRRFTTIEKLCQDRQRRAFPKTRLIIQ